MTPQTINTEVIEGNRIIADSPFSNCTKSFETYFNTDKKFHFEIDEAEYHTSWDWLIPCLQKAKQAIKEAGWGTPTEKEAWSRLNAALNEVYNLNIENAHFCFVKFIKWYNDQFTKKEIPL